MSIPNRERVVQCIYPITPLVGGGSYIVLRDGLDPFTKQPMVELAGGARFWSWRFEPWAHLKPRHWQHPGASFA